MNDLSTIEHFVATVGFPIAITIAILVVIYKLARKICCTAGESAKNWFDEQTELAKTLKETATKQITIIEDLSKHATHGHKAMFHALDGVDALAAGDKDNVTKHIEKAKDTLLHDENGK